MLDYSVRDIEKVWLRALWRLRNAVRHYFFSPAPMRRAATLDDVPHDSVGRQQTRDGAVTAKLDEDRCCRLYARHLNLVSLYRSCEDAVQLLYIGCIARRMIAKMPQIAPGSISEDVSSKNFLGDMHPDPPRERATARCNFMCPPVCHFLDPPL